MRRWIDNVNKRITLFKRRRKKKKIQRISKNNVKKKVRGMKIKPQEKIINK